MPVSEEMKRILAIFKEVMNRKIDMNNFKDRLILQKMTYLIKKFDKSVNYEFNWYVRGPYSSDVAEDAYNAWKIPLPDITPEDNRIAQNIKTIQSNKLNEKDFELFASVYYLLDERNTAEDNEIVFTVLSTKPWFTKEEVFDAIKKIKKIQQILTKQ